MPRTVKHFLYGLLYLSIVGLIAFPLIYPKLQTVATCTDNIQNQSEEGVDCGGECEACGLRGLALKTGVVEAVEIGDRTTFLVELENPSSEFGLGGVFYSFKFLNRLSQLLASSEGVVSLLPNEKKYIVESGVNIKRNEIGEVLFELGETEFVLLEELPQYKVSIENATTTFSEEEVSVSGLLRNSESFAIREVRLATNLYTQEGSLANAGTTLVTSIPPFGSKEFLFKIPKNSLFVDPEKTVVYKIIVLR